MHKGTETKVKTLLKVLVDAKSAGEGFLWTRELSRRTKMNPATISWITNRYLWDKLEFMEVDPLIEKGLKIKPLTLKQEVYEEILKRNKRT